MCYTDRENLVQNYYVSRKYRNFRVGIIFSPSIFYAFETTPKTRNICQLTPIYRPHQVLPPSGSGHSMLFAY